MFLLTFAVFICEMSFNLVTTCYLPAFSKDNTVHKTIYTCDVEGFRNLNMTHYHICVSKPVSVKNRIKGY